MLLLQFLTKHDIYVYRKKNSFCKIGYLTKTVSTGLMAKNQISIRNLLIIL